MAYDDYNLSVSDSQPDELYEFDFQGTNGTYNVTSSAFPITFEGKEYTPIAIGRGGIQHTREVGKNGLTLQLDRNNDFFKRQVLASVEYSTLGRLYSLQPDGSFVLSWSGVVKTVVKTPKHIEVTMSPISTNANRPILHRKYQMQCPHALYSHYCGIDPDLFTDEGSVTSVVGAVLEAGLFASKADGWYTGGTITIGDEKKTIMSHFGDTITVLDAFFEASSGNWAIVRAGCPHTLDACISKFDNYENYGGCPWIPTDDIITDQAQFTY